MMNENVLLDGEMELASVDWFLKWGQTYLFLFLAIIRGWCTQMEAKDAEKRKTCGCFHRTFHHLALYFYFMHFFFYLILWKKRLLDSLPHWDGVARFHPHCPPSFLSVENNNIVLYIALHYWYTLHFGHDLIQLFPCLWDFFYLINVNLLVWLKMSIRNILFPSKTNLISLPWLWRNECYINYRQQQIKNKKAVVSMEKIGNKICEKSDQPRIQMTSQRTLSPWKRQALLY